MGYFLGLGVFGVRGFGSFQRFGFLGFLGLVCGVWGIWASGGVEDHFKSKAHAKSTPRAPPIGGTHGNDTLNPEP